MNKEILHQKVEALNLQARNAIAVHALIELGIITSIECTAAQCSYDSREFSPSNWNRKLCLSFDHIIPKRRGGSHRPCNIRLKHVGCNAAWRENDLEHVM